MSSLTKEVEFLHIVNHEINYEMYYEMFEDTKGIIRCHTSKNSSLGVSMVFCVVFCSPWFSLGPFSFVLLLRTNLLSLKLLKNCLIFHKDIDNLLKSILSLANRSEELVLTITSCDLAKMVTLYVKSLNINCKLEHSV
jgi:hypothetical protein